MTTLIQYLRRIADCQPGPEVADGELLDRFARTRDEAAFAAIVRRHGPMVLGVCRRSLVHSQDAEDAFQATFLVLVKKASGIRQGDRLAGWLYGVALRTSAKARANARRRQAREQALAGSVPDRESSQHVVDRSILDDEVRRLPRRYRWPVVLCYLEGLTNEEAARRLGCPKGTVQSRLAWARDRLRRRLAGRGMDLCVEHSSFLLMVGEVPALVPPPLHAETVRAGLDFAGGAAAGGSISGPVAALTRGVLQTMFMTKLKICGLFAMAILLLGGGAGLWTRPPAQAEEPVVAAATPQPPTPSAPAKPHDHAVSHHDDGHETVREEISKTFQTGKSPKLIVEMFNGGITLVAEGDAGVSVKVTKEGRGKTKEEAQTALKNVDVQMAQEGETVRITSRPIDEHLHDLQFGAKAELKVPAGSDVTLNTHNGAITASGGTGPFTLHTSNGGIHVKDNSGAHHLTTSNGRITVAGGNGKQELKTSNGPIDVRADKAAVSARTTNGSVHFEGTLADGKHSFVSSNGSVTVKLPAESRFRYDASTSRGHITNEFTPSTDQRGRRTHQSGTVGDNPTTDIELRTSNGSITLARAK